MNKQDSVRTNVKDRTEEFRTVSKSVSSTTKALA